MEPDMEQVHPKESQTEPIGPAQPKQSQPKIAEQVYPRDSKPEAVEAVHPKESQTGIDQGNGCYIPKRFVLALMTFFGWAVAYCLRTSLSVAIVAMANHKSQNCTQESEHCKVSEFVWSSQLQGVILSSFFYGYVILQVPGGLLALRFGGQRVFSVAIFIASVLTLLTPVLTKESVYLLVALRILEGLVLGVTASASHGIWSKWSPVYERTMIVAFSFTGCPVGTVFSMPITGLLVDSRAQWPSAFYLFGGLGVLWYIIWVLVTHESPKNHPTISKAELEIIGEAWVDTHKTEVSSIPWKFILTSSSVWAIMLGQFAADWSFYTVLICIPQYIKYVLGFNISETGFASAMPYVVMSIIGPITGYTADVMRRHNVCSTGTVRKCLFCFGMLTSSATLVAMGYTRDPNTAIILLIIGVGLQGVTGGGICVNHLDISLKYAGLLMGMSNTMGTCAGFLSPMLVGAITHHQTPAEWRRVFFISAFISCVGCIIFVIFSSGKKQRWADD